MPRLSAIGGGGYAQDLRPAPQSRPSEPPGSDVLESSHFGPPPPLPCVPQLKSGREGCKCFITFESFIRTVRPGGREERREEPPRGSVWPEDRARTSQAWKAKEKCQRGERRAESERKRGRRGWGEGLRAGLQKRTDDRNRPARLFTLRFIFSFFLYDPVPPAPRGPEGKQARGRAKSPAAPERCHCPFWRSNAGPAAVAGAIPTPQPPRRPFALRLPGELRVRLRCAGPPRAPSVRESEIRGAHRAERGRL